LARSKNEQTDGDGYGFVTRIERGKAPSSASAAALIAAALAAGK
jgi:hypothetical protein